MRNRHIPQGPMRKSKNPLKTVKRLLSYLAKNYKFHLLAVLCLIIISSVTGVISSLFLGTIIDDYITPLMFQPNPDFSGLLSKIFTMAGIFFGGILAVWLQNFIMVSVVQGVLKNIRKDMFSHMQRLPIKYFDTHSHGDVMSHYTNDTDTLRQMISQSLPQTFSALITVISVFIAMIKTNIYLTIFVILMVAFMMFITKKIGSNSAKYFIKQQKSLGKVNGYIEEMINGQKVVKVFCHENDAIKKFDVINEELFSDGANAHKFANILMPIMGNLGHLQYALIAIIGGILSISGVTALTIGNISSFLLLSKSFWQPISQISQQINSVIMALAGAERIFGLLDEEIEQDNGYVTLVRAKRNENGEFIESTTSDSLWVWKHPHKDGTISYHEVLGDVRFNDVTFGYDEKKMVLHNIDLYAKPKQKIAFVGATGAGKTTITNLINRFYDIPDGKIRYDGININKIKKDDLRRSLGIVLQDVNLFSGTIMENIRYGNLDATDEDVYRAAKLANADGFINMLPNGYDTVISGNGSDLSQGQRQLLSIARAAVLNPPVMILDEATSSIDTRTEAIVQKGMDSLMRGRTVFVIAHRLSTVKNSDVIMVLENGKIIERGSHDELINQKGKYCQLYTGAFEEKD